MRVLFIVHGFPPDALGGTELYTRDLASALARRGEEIFVLTRRNDAGANEYEVAHERSDDLQIFRIQNSFGGCRSFEDTYRNPALRKVAAGLLDRIRPDVAHVQHLTCLSSELLEELRERQIRTLVTLNDYWMICHRGQLFDRNLERCAGPLAGCDQCLGPEAVVGASGYAAANLLKRAGGMLPEAVREGLKSAGAQVAERSSPFEAMIEARDRRVRHMQGMLKAATAIQAPSRTLEQRFLDFGVDRERLFHAEQGIDLQRLAKIRRAGSEILRIGFLGSLMVSKAPHVLVEAFRGLPTDRAELSIYGGWADYHGDDSYRARMEQALRGVSLRHFGPVQHHEIPDVLGNLDVLVISSTWIENAPFVIREAFAAGLPVVASRLGGMQELVRDEICGLLFEPGDTADLRRVLRRLLDEPELLPRLRSQLPVMKSIDQDAREMITRYRDLRASSGASPSEKGLRTGAVVLHYKTPIDTRLAVRSLQAAEEPPHRILVVVNGAVKPPLDGLDRLLAGPEILDGGGNLGFSGGCNLGIERSLEGGDEAILLLNSDAWIPPELPGRLLEILDSRPDVGIVAPVIMARSSPDLVASAGMRFSPATGRMLHLRAGERLAAGATLPSEEVDGVSGAAMLIRSQALREIGLLDEQFFFSFEDLDLCLRARKAGWKVMTAGGLVAYHQGSASMGFRSPDRIYYATRNHLLLAKRYAAGSWSIASVLALNLAHVLLTSPIPRSRGLRAWASGARDYFRDSFGQR